MEEMELDLRDILNIIYKQRLLILILLGCALIAAWVANEVTPPVYKAETKLLVQGDKSQLVLTELLPGSSPDRELANFTQIMKSNAVLQKAAGSSKEAQLLKDSVTIQPETGSDLITISVEGEDPKWAAKMANNLVEAFSERLAEIIRQQARSARIFIEEQLELVKKDLATSEEKLKAYKEQNQILEPQGEIAQVIQHSARIKAQLEEARLASLEAERQIASLSGALSTREKEILSATTFTRNPLIAQYQSKIGELEVELAGSREKYTDQHPTVISLEAQLAQAKKELAKQVAEVVGSQTRSLNPTYQGIEQSLISLRAQALASDAKAAALKSLVNAVEAELAALPQKELELTRLAREVKVREEIFLMLSQRREEMKITEAMQTGDVHVIDPAVAPSAPIKPRKLLNFAISLLLALFAGVGMAFLLEYLDDTIKTPQELEAELGLPVLGTIPMLTEEMKFKRRKVKSKHSVRQVR